MSYDIATYQKLAGRSYLLVDYVNSSLSANCFHQQYLLLVLRIRKKPRLVPLKQHVGSTDNHSQANTPNTAQTPDEARVTYEQANRVRFCQTPRTPSSLRATSSPGPGSEIYLSVSPGVTNNKSKITSTTLRPRLLDMYFFVLFFVMRPARDGEQRRGFMGLC